MNQSKIALLSVCVAGVLFGQEATQSSQSSAANLPVQRIGPNDLLALSVYGAPELSRSVRVSSEGTIRLPMLAAPLQAAGRLPSELEEEIRGRLTADQILVDPVVTVTMVEYHSRPVSVAGAVNRPTTFQAEEAISLLDALSRAGGLSGTAGPEILVTRRQPGSDGTPVALVQRIPVQSLMDAADPELNVTLHGGEEIRVPEAGRVYVVGNVKRPGEFPIRDAAETTVLKVLALSEGLAPFAASDAYVYRRDGATGGNHEIPLELNAILRRKSPDVPLMPNDILYVPDNRGKRISLSAIERVLSFGAATASGILVWGVAR